MQSPLNPRDLKDQNVLVLGLGSFGGGAGAARALYRLGAKVAVSDLRDASRLPEASAILAECQNIEWTLGSHPESLFHGQTVVVNPAIPTNSRILEIAKEAGCRLVSEVDLALAARPELRCLAITGTHGKSTCASLGAHLLENAGIPTLLAGNLGGSLLEAVLDLSPDTRLVLELSSFQTENLSPPPGWPEVSALTCLGSDHLDRHQTIDNYWQAKRRLLIAQNEECLCLVPTTGPGVEEWSAACRGQIVRLDPDSPQAQMLLEDAPFNEPYRLPSLLAAVKGAIHLGCPQDAIATGLRSWPGLPHRMQHLPSPHSSLKIIDNGVATHPEPTVAALGELEGRVILCAGGYDKQLDLNTLATAANRCAAVHLSGPGGTRLAELMGMTKTDLNHHPTAIGAFKAAFRSGIEHSEQGPTTLLYSPSFSSFDEYSNFRDRALEFHKIVQTMPLFFSNTDIS